MSKRHLFWLALALAAPAPALAAPADDFPSRPVTILVPNPPGGTTDIVTRLLAAKLADTLGPVIVDNRPGGSTTIAGRAVQRAQPDGYTLVMASFGTVINPYVMPDAPYTYRDFAPVSLVVNTPNVLLVNQERPAASVADLVRQAKAAAAPLTYASTSVAGSPHLSGAWFSRASGTGMVHVPFQGAAPALTALAGGHVDAMFDNLPSALGQIRAGRMRALAVTTRERAQTLPEVPTFAEAGYADYEVNAWFGLLAPADTPIERRERLAEAVRQALADEDVQRQLVQMGAQPVASTPAAFADFLAAEDRRWKEFMAENGPVLE